MRSARIDESGNIKVRNLSVVMRSAWINSFVPATGGIVTDAQLTLSGLSFWSNWAGNT